MRFFVAALCIFAAATAKADPLQEFYRGARAMALGNTFVGIADDEEAIFYNPAGLAGITKSQIQYVVTDLDVSTDFLSTAQDLNSLNGASGDSLNTFMGKNLYGRASIAPSLVMPNFGVSLISDGQMGVFAENKALPQMQMLYQTTNGVQLAYGVSLSKRGPRAKDDFRLGVATKLMWRRGGFRSLSLVDMLSVSLDKLKSIAGNFERGIGADLGMQYIRRINPRVSASLGMDFADIGDTSFGSADAQKANLSLGSAVTYEEGVFKAIIAYDYRHALDTADWRKKNHFGLEVDVPFVNIYAGLNQTFLTYGLAFDAWLFRFTTVSYGEELGTYAGQDGNRRYLLHLSLKFGL